MRHDDVADADDGDDEPVDHTHYRCPGTGGDDC